jgi:CheY-like chemotaxis protein
MLGRCYCRARVLDLGAISLREEISVEMKEESTDKPSEEKTPKGGRDRADAQTSPRVLIVEDQFATGIDIQDQLTRLGYVVVGITAYGEEAVELAETLRPDLILMDINLRGELNGVAAAEQIRSRFSLSVVYVTANAALARAQRSQPFDYILKPFQPRELAAVVERALLKQK